MILNTNPKEKSHNKTQFKNCYRIST